MANLLRTAAAALFLALLFPALAPAQSVEQGKFGRGLKVGTTYAAAEHSPFYAVTPVTVELWARVNGRLDASTLLSNEPRISLTHWELYTERETGRFAASTPGFDPPTLASKVDIADDQWHYLAFIFDGTQVRLSVDGKEVAKQAVKKVKPFPDTGPLNFGFQPGVAPHPDTTIDEVRISKTARDVSAVPGGPFAADADTIGLWHFDEDEKAYAKLGGFADAATLRNNASLKDVKVEGQLTNGGFDNTVGGKTRWQDMDFGPFFSSTITPPLNKTNVTYKGISIRLGKEKKHAVTFDTELLRMSAAWEGPFIKMYPGREGLGNHPEMGAKPLFQTSVGPGWAVGDSIEALKDPRPNKLGPLSKDSARYSGLYVHGDRVLLLYFVGEGGILESYGVRDAPGGERFTRVINVNNFKAPLIMVAANAPKSAELTFDEDPGEGTRVRWPEGNDEESVLWFTHHPEGAVVKRAEDGRITLSFGPAEGVRTIGIEFWRQKRNAPIPQQKTDAPDLKFLGSPPPAMYPPIVTKGQLGKADGPYAVDTLTAPDDNPWHSFLRFGGVDFFKNGDAAVCSVSGDVWIVSGIDEKLATLTWKRFATGLFQPLGLKIVDDEIYVLGRDQITHLLGSKHGSHEGEALFYENFNNDGLVTASGHAYVTCLERDPAGNFYYIKCGDNTPQGGSVLRVSPDGKKLEVFATGVRNGNGLGMSPGGQLSFADNEGDWVPASRIDLVKQGQFLGYTPMAHTDTPPPNPGKPIVWLPQNVDNSSGGQVWVEGDKWGLPAGTMLHTSYGGASLLEVMPETVKEKAGGDVVQAGVWRFPLTFSTGIMRGRFRPQDGQLYVCGLRGWQTAGTKDGALQRVRYTGKPSHMPADLHVHQNGVRLTFTSELDKETASDAGSWSVLQWNYHWSSEYGSKHWSVKNPTQQGYDTLEVKKATLLPDGKSVFLEIPGLEPVMQMRISCNIEAKDGTTIRTDVYNTIHAPGPKFEVPAGK